MNEVCASQIKVSSPSVGSHREEAEATATETDHGEHWSTYPDPLLVAQVVACGAVPAHRLKPRDAHTCHRRHQQPTQTGHPHPGAEVRNKGEARGGIIGLGHHWKFSSDDRKGFGG